MPALKLGLHSDAQQRIVPAVILFGPPGSGKGTQAKLLLRTCVSGPHISTGDMLRRHIQAGDSIGRSSEALIKSGKLAPDELVNEVMKQRIAEPDCRAGMILDGYPRTLNQARVLLKLLAESGFEPAVVHLMVDYDKVVARLSGRQQCPVCGTLYSLKTSPSKIPGVCDRDGAALVTREDDREDVIRERLNEYESLTSPLLDYFRETGVPMFAVEGADAPPEEISERICSSLASSGLVNGSGRVKTPVTSVGP